MAEYLPLVAMVTENISASGVDVLSKLALNTGLNLFVFVSYRMMLATSIIAPIALIFERNNRPTTTLQVMGLWLLISTLGGTLSHVLFYWGLQHSTTVVASATGNLLPAMTFLVAVVFRQEKIGIKKTWGQMKLAGTCLCVGGAMVLSFYRGPMIIKALSGGPFNHGVGHRITAAGHPSLAGTIILVGSRLCRALWLITQELLSTKYQADLKNTAMMCLLSSVQCSLIAVSITQEPAAWTIKANIQLAALLYTGIFGSAGSIFVLSCVISRKGPLYASVFSPLSLIFVTVVSWAGLGQHLFFGMFLGAVILLVGLYIVLWGQRTERREAAERERAERELQMQVLDGSNIE